MNKLLVFLQMATVLSLSGCYAYSSFQSARTIEPGHFEGTASYSSNTWSYKGNSETINAAYEAQLRAGMTERSDIGFRYARVYVDGTKEDYNFMAVEPKFMIIEDRLSLIVPAALYFGENVQEEESFHVSPGLVVTYPVTGNFEASASSRYMIFTDRD